MSLYDVTMPMFGITDCCRFGLSSPAAAMTCARFAQASLPRAGSTSLRLRVRSRYSPRAAAERPPMRSVTSTMVGCSAGAFISFVPAVAVPLGQRDRGGRTPRAGGVWLHELARRLPARLDAVDPVPRRFDLVTPDEQRRVALQRVQQQTLVRDARAAAALVLRQGELERHFAQPHAFETGLFAQDLERHALFRLQVDDEPVRRKRRFVGGEDVVRHGLELDRDVGAA